MQYLRQNKWKFDEKGRSPAYFSKEKQGVVSRNMIGELKKLAKGKVNARFCLNNSPGENLQDMVILAYRDITCKKPHKHTKGKEAIQMIEGKALAVIINKKGALVDKRVLSPKGNFAYRNESGNYHIYLPLTHHIVIREIRDVKNRAGETVPFQKDHIEVVRKYIPKKYLYCLNDLCKNPCGLNKRKKS